VADKLGFTTAIAKQFAAVLQDVQASGRETQLFAYSQGGAITASAVGYLNATGGGSLSNISVLCNGCANNRMVSASIFASAGISSVRYDPGASFRNGFDAVANIVGLNTLNPIRLIGSLLAIPLLFGPNSTNPHAY